MPFKEEIVHSVDLAQLDPQGVFDVNSVFGGRIFDQQQKEKQQVAWYIAKEWFSTGRRDAFITDGSSTFYVCLAISVMHRQQTAHICTNNLAISTELDARGGTQNLDLELLGGKKDAQLDAALGEEAIVHANNFLKDCNLVISSVRQLQPERGPTAPERKSRRIKKVAITQANLLIIVVDWEKLATPPIDSADLTFSNMEDWENILKNKEIIIVSSAPQDLVDENSFTVGQKIRATNKYKFREKLTTIEKYALNVFLLSEVYGVNFIEIKLA